MRFIHVLGADGRPVTQEDSPPCTGAYPATSWLPGEVLIEQARLILPAELATGTYRLAVGWYDATTFQWLPVKTAVPEESVVVLRTKLDYLVAFAPITSSRQVSVPGRSADLDCHPLDGLSMVVRNDLLPSQKPIG